ncbi:hypothetical protein WICPIJ_005783 [Wickerhamomyces pijperi]|uniref:Uncharacterized protein n=1 Tax=Wickerhamomyces pijperi TaxID=599730 RepID=A0A9P8TLN0_WICPI|nr:hypothetical protein WICPIJ_005783 [Wickerhamomyces pijperi]
MFLYRCDSLFPSLLVLFIATLNANSNSTESLNSSNASNMIQSYLSPKPHSFTYPTDQDAIVIQGTTKVVFPYKMQDRYTIQKDVFHLKAQEILTGTSVLKYYIDEIDNSKGFEDIFPLIEREIFSGFSKCLKDRTVDPLTIITSKEYLNKIPEDPMKHNGIYITVESYDTLDEDKMSDESSYNRDYEWIPISQFSPFAYQDIRSMKFLQSVVILDENENVLGKFQIRNFLKYRSGSVLELEVDGYNWAIDKIGDGNAKAFKQCKFATMKSFCGSKQGFQRQIWYDL